MSGMYKMFLRVATVEALVTRMGRVWGTFFEGGTPAVEDLSRTSGVFVVQGYPKLVKTQRDYIAGYLVGLLELTGATKIQVICRDDTPQAWRWKLFWKP
jgi:hypothetical protein